MAEAMLYQIRKDQGRPSCAKRLMSRSGLEKTPPLVRDSAMSPLSGMSEDPPERVLSPRATTRRSVRTSSPADSGNDSEGEPLPSYEVMMRETFSPISPAPLELPILPDLDEEATMTMREDVKPIAEVKAAPPADPPVEPGVDEAGFLGTNGLPMYHMPPPNLLYNMPNVPLGSTLAHRASVDTPCSRICILVPAQYAGVVQRVYGGDPVVTIQATSFNVAGTRNMIQMQGSLPVPSTNFIGAMHVNGYSPIY